MSKTAQEKIENALKDTRNTITMVKKFLILIQKDILQDQDIKSDFEAFKELYSDQPYYKDVKDSILEQVEMIGIDASEVESYLA